MTMPSSVLLLLIIFAQPPGEPPRSAEETALIELGAKLAEPLLVHANDSELQKLLKERTNVAAFEWKLRHEAFRTNRTAHSTYLTSGRHLRDCKLAFATDKDKISVLEQYHALTKWDADLQFARFQAGAFRKESDYYVFRFEEVDAEITLVSSGGKAFQATIYPELSQSTLPEPTDFIENLNIPELAKLGRFAIKAGIPDIERLRRVRANIGLEEFRHRTNAYRQGRETHLDWQECWERTWRSIKAEVIEPHLVLRLAILNRDCQRRYFEEKVDSGRWPDFRDEYRMRMCFDFIGSEIQVRKFAEQLQKQSTFAAPTIIAITPQFSNAVSNSTREYDLGENPPMFCQSKNYAIDRSAHEMIQLRHLRANCMLREVAIRYSRFRVGSETLEDMFDAGERARDARLELSTTPAEKTLILNEYLGFTKSVENLQQARFEVGAIREADLYRSKFQRMTAEIDVKVLQGAK